MNYFMVRSFDHAGYYETRLILMVVGLAVAGHVAFWRRDYRYLVMFASGVLFQGLMEFTLQTLGLRGSDYSLTVFGVRLPFLLAVLYQGCVEGGILSLMGFWFVDLRTRSGPEKLWWAAYVAVYVLIVILGFVVGKIAQGEPLSSPRPIFGPITISLVLATILVSLLLVYLRARRKSEPGFRLLGWFYLGCFIYVMLNFGPMHIMGVRYVAVGEASGQFVPAPQPYQGLLMLWSHLFEVVGGKVHYFAVPYALGLLKAPE